MPHTETPLDVPRVWAEIPDPEHADGSPPAQVFRVDLTWLTSSWTCIFGRGCAGIFTDRPDDGCCTLGAHFSDADDEKRVGRRVRELDAAGWQRHEQGRKRNGGWTEVDEDGARKTRVVDGRCIFFNDTDFAGGYGCAFHHLAERQGIPHARTKPDVCWQLPLRRTYRTVDRGDGTSYLEVTVAEYDRRGWGAGGLDLDWYCTGNPDAHVGAVPVYVSMADELRELLGDAGYDVVAAECERAMGARKRLPLLVHPATAAGRARRRPAPRADAT